MPNQKDINEIAKSILDDIIEETESEDFEETERKKIARTGGKARAAKLTPEKRSEIAKKAAQSRWRKES